MVEARNEEWGGVMTPVVTERRWLGADGSLNTTHHKASLTIFMLIVVLHWVEHLAQAYQVYLLGWPRPAAGGALGLAFPVLVSSEWLHYGYAVFMMVAFIVLRHGFTGRSRTWWNAAMWIQIWHHFEHLLLLLQAMTGSNLLGAAQPTSIAQLLFSRIELHLFYNTVVFVPMVVAMVYHLRPNAPEHEAMDCSCRRELVGSTTG
jgi:hypothetical protein